MEKTCPRESEVLGKGAVPLIPPTAVVAVEMLSSVLRKGQMHLEKTCFQQCIIG